MDLVRCEFGHFYDADRFSKCPHCERGTDDDGAEVTVAKFDTISSVPKLDKETLEQAVMSAKDEDDDVQKTVGFYSGSMGKEPVVGWLVCVEGEHFGEDFALKTGRNFIGRSKDMDIVLDKDNGVSREKHAIVLFEPKHNLFIVQPGDAKELFYLNDKVVLAAEEIHAYDAIALGDCKLIFVPFCNDKINWNSIEKQE